MNMTYKKRTYIWLAVALPVAGSLGGCGKETDSPADTGIMVVEETSSVEPGIQLVQGIGQLIPDDPDYEVVEDIIILETEPVPEYLREDVEHAEVVELQARLMELGSVDNDEPTQYFDYVTQATVPSFQGQNELNMGDTAGPGAWNATMTLDVKYYAVPNGVLGKDIRRIQNRLYELGYPAIPNLATGKSGDMTETVVTKPWEVNGITVDGKAGRQIINLPCSDETRPNMLTHDDKSEMVLIAQKRLKDLGYLTADPDGSYDFNTTAAVKQLQSRNDLVANDYLGSSTRLTLDDSSAASNGMSLGNQGDSVQRVQQLLSKYGYLSSNNVMGYYREVTGDTVRNLQSINGLSSNGSVGKLTMARLTGGNVKKTVSKNGTSSGGGNDKKSSFGSNGGSSDGGGGGVSSLISMASSKLSSPYVYGARGPNSFDCSGFVYWCLNQVGARQSYSTSSGQRNVGKYIKISNFGDLRAGDTIVVNGHIDIVINEGTVIDAFPSNGKVAHRSSSS